MALKALLFDVDGTLADTEPHGHLPAYNAAFEEMGLSWRWTPELYRKLLWQPGGRERLRYFIKHHKPELGVYKSKVEDDTDGWVSDTHAIKSRYFMQRVQDGKVPLRPGVKRLIQEAKQEGLKIAIVTNASSRSLEPFLKHALGDELLSDVDDVISGEQVQRKKPAPDLYQEALKRLDIEPDECVAIEDSEMGLHAASGAGIATLITVNDDTRDHDFSEAAMVVSQLGECVEPIECVKGYCEGEVCITLALLEQMLASEHSAQHNNAAS